MTSARGNITRRRGGGLSNEGDPSEKQYISQRISYFNMRFTNYHLTVLNKDPPGNVWIWLRSCVANRTGHLRAFYTFWPLQIVPHFLSGGNITSKLQSHHSLISPMFLLKYQRISSFFLFWWIVQFSTLIPRPSKTCEVLYQAVGSHPGKSLDFWHFL